MMPYAPPTARLLLAALCWAAVCPARSLGDQPPVVQRAADDLPQKGMTAAAVRAKYGAPKRIARQILYRRHLEVWTYDGPTPLQIEFDCPRGEDATVLSVQTRGKPAGPPPGEDPGS